MKIWVVRIEDFSGVFSSKENAVDAIIQFCDDSSNKRLLEFTDKAKILDFTDTDDGFFVRILWQESTNYEHIETYPIYWCNLDEYDPDFNRYVKTSDWED